MLNYYYNRFINILQMGIRNLRDCNELKNFEQNDDCDVYCFSGEIRIRVKKNNYYLLIEPSNKNNQK